MKITAKCVSENFWIMQSNGRKVGNIQVEPSGVTVQQGTQVEHFDRLEDIARKYPVEFVRYVNEHPQVTEEVLGYPTRGMAHNPEWDVQHHLPLYTSESDSRSKRCAGYYMVNKNEQGWKTMWCPKLITLRRNPYEGPFQTKEDLLNYWNQSHADDPAYTTV